MSDTKAIARARTTGIADAFRRSVRLYARRTAVESEDGWALTYAELDDLADGIARYLLTLGIGRGDRIAVLSDPCPEFVAVNVACAKLGLTSVGLNTRFTAEDVEFCTRDSDARALFVDPAHHTLLERLDATGEGRPVVALSIDDRSVHGLTTLGSLLAGVGDRAVDPSGEPDDIHSIIYTSGTTGRPKGAMISQAAAAVRALRLISWFGLTMDDAHVGWTPMFHTGGNEPLYATLMSGGRFMTYRRADPERLVDAFENRAATWGWLLPGMFAEFLDVVAERGAGLGSMRFSGGYGNLLPTRLIDDLVDRGVAFYDLFGQTETSLLVASNRIVDPGESEWRKWPTPLMDIRIVDDHGDDLGVGAPGECVVRGPSVMSGYLNQPAATDEVFAGGWLHTGDVLEWNDDGTLRFTDRKRYLIKTGGENVYPAEVEQVVATHPAVAEVCVIGVPDERWGETVKAFVVVRPNFEADIAGIDEHCRARLARFKRPRLIEFVEDEDLPRSVTGKIIRPELAKRTILQDQRVAR